MLQFEAYYITEEDMEVPRTFIIYPHKIQTDVQGEAQDIAAPTILPYTIPLGVKPQTIKIDFDCESADSKILESIKYEMPITFKEPDPIYKYYEISPDYIYYISDIDIKLDTGSDQDSVSITFITTWESVAVKGWELIMHLNNSQIIYPISKVEISKQVNDINKAKIEIVLTRDQILAEQTPESFEAESIKYSIIFGRDVGGGSYNTVFVGYLDRAEDINKNRMTILLKSVMNELKFKMVTNPTPYVNPFLNVGGIISGWLNKYHPFKMTLPYPGHNGWSLRDYIFAILNEGKSGWNIGGGINYASFFEYALNPSTESAYTEITLENVSILQGLKSLLYEESGLDFWAATNGERRIYYDIENFDPENIVAEEYYMVAGRHYYPDFVYDTVAIEIDKYYDSVSRVYVFGNDGQEYGAFGADGVFYSTAYPPQPDTAPTIIFKLNTGVVSELKITNAQVTDWLEELTDADKEDPEKIKAALERRGITVFTKWVDELVRNISLPVSFTLEKTYYINDYSRLAQTIYENLGRKKEKFILTALVSNDRDDDDNLIWNVNEGDWITFSYVRNPIVYAETYGDDSGNYESMTAKIKAVKINGQKVTIELGSPRNSFFDLIERKMTEVRQGNITGTRTEFTLNSGDLA